MDDVERYEPPAPTSRDWLLASIPWALTPVVLVALLAWSRG